MHFDDLIAKYDYFLFDCDGVLWHGADQIDGSFDALAKL
jgi:ribonucleotide monophosphatase NagD (HAD superfamily)